MLNIASLRLDQRNVVSRCVLKSRHTSTPWRTPATSTSCSEFLHPTSTPGILSLGASDGQNTRINPSLRAFIRGGQEFRFAQNDPLLLNCSRAEMPASGGRGCCDLRSDAVLALVYVSASGRLTNSDSLLAIRSIGIRNRAKKRDNMAKPFAARV